MKENIEYFNTIMFVVIVYMFASFMIGLIPAIILKLIFVESVLLHGPIALLTATIIGFAILTSLILYDIRK